MDTCPTFTTTSNAYQMISLFRDAERKSKVLHLALSARSDPAGSAGSGDFEAVSQEFDVLSEEATASSTSAFRTTFMQPKTTSGGISCQSYSPRTYLNSFFIGAISIIILNASSIVDRR